MSELASALANSNESLEFADSPPKASELEVSIFGPGVGECVVVHLGFSEWMIVDSCIDRQTRMPVAKAYLTRLGVALDAVKLVVVTHWHDDHMRGAAEIVREAGAARFACSAALRSEEFATLLACGAESMTSSSGIDEFRKILDALRQRRARGVPAANAGPDHWATHGQVLYERPARDGVSQARVLSLSPSAATVTRALRELGQLLPQEGEPKRRIRQGANQVSVALWIDAGYQRALLGSDLPAGTGPSGGWSAVLSSSTRPAQRARILKVPHHGSQSADEPAIWTEMLEAEPWAVVTPFASGKTPLPTEADLKRLIKRTPNAYCTGRPQGWSPVRRQPGVERTLREVARSRRTILGPVGHVRLRYSLEAADPTVELFGGALKVSA